MAEKDTIFWDVDTQFDFLKPEGRLYVPGAAKIIEPISRTRVFALENGYSIIASMDWHSLEDEEISTTPDFKETFPPHCMAFESGSERLGYLGDVP
ncbi:MAG: cysteine hydrolase family protein, partial [Planctomycetota bacterium]